MSFMLLGILNSQASSGVGFDLLSSVTLASDTASVTFTSGGEWTKYKHLQVRIIMRTSTSAALDSAKLVINSDTASNYDGGQIYVASSTIGSYQVHTTGATLLGGSGAGATNTANVFGYSVADFLDINGTGYKHFRELSGHAGDVPSVVFNSGQWRNNSAITSLLLSPQSGANFKAGSGFAIYGIAG